MPLHAGRGTVVEGTQQQAGSWVAGEGRQGGQRGNTACISWGKGGRWHEQEEAEGQRGR